MSLEALIPGYKEALAFEQEAREEAYLDAPAFICGVPVRQITPRLLAVLFYIRTPFLWGGMATPGHVGQFLWAIHLEYVTEGPAHPKRDAFLHSIEGMDFGKAEVAIDAFLEKTFLDAPYGGKEATPYVCSVAWIEWRMAQKPFGWAWEDRTANTPLRRIYQLIRCEDMRSGKLMVNRKSEGLRGDWLASIQGKSQEEIEDINRLARHGAN